MIPLYIALVPGTLIASEIALRLPLSRILGALRDTPLKAARVIASPRISDVWKERVLPCYAARIMGASLGLLGCLVAIALPVGVAAAFASSSPGAALAGLMRPLPLVQMMALGAGYVVLRGGMRSRRTETLR